MPAANDNAKIISTIATMKRQRKVVFMSIISLISTIGPANKKDKIDPVVKLRAYARAKKTSMLEQIENDKTEANHGGNRQNNVAADGVYNKARDENLSGGGDAGADDQHGE